MKTAITVAELRSLGLKLEITSRGTLFVSPRTLVTPELIERIRKSKPDLIRALTRKSIASDSETTTQVTERPESTRKTRLSGGVGTELKKLIPKFFEKSGCGCGDYARQLDTSGVNWCVRNRQKIIDRLVKKATETFIGSLSETLDRYVATCWVDQAIAATKRAIIDAEHSDNCPNDEPSTRD